MPTTGITKKPTMPSSAPSNRVLPGTPSRFIRRPGTAYLTTVPTRIRAAATPNTAQPVAVPTWVAQTRIAPSTSSEPGSPGTTMPTSPTAIARPTSRLVTVTGAASHLVHGQRGAPGRRPGAPATSCLCASGLVVARDRGSVPELVGLVVELGGDLAQLGAVLTGVVGAEEQLTTRGEHDAKVGLGPAPVAPLDRGERRARSSRCGHWSHFPSTVCTRPTELHRKSFPGCALLTPGSTSNHCEEFPRGGCPPDRPA